MTSPDQLRKMIAAGVFLALVALGFGACSLHVWWNEKFNADRFFGLGLQAAWEHKPDEAIRNYDWAIWLKPGSELFHYNRAQAYMEKGDFQRACDDYTRMIERDSKSAAAYLNRGECYRLMRKDDLAIADFKDAVRLGVVRANAYLGEIYLTQKNYDAAVATFSLAIDHLSQGDGPMMIDGQQVAMVDPNPIDVFYERGMAYMKKGDVDHALADFKQAAENNPMSVATNAQWAKVSLQKGDEEQAFIAVEKAIALEPGSGDLYNDLGRAYLIKGDQGNAAEAFQQAIQLNPRLAEARNNLAAVFNRLGEYDQAIAQCDEAIMINPDMAEAYANRAVSYLHKKNFAKAIEDTSRAIAIDPHLLIAYDNRAGAYALEGDYSNAIRDYEQLLKLDPDNVRAQQNLVQVRALSGSSN